MGKMLVVDDSSVMRRLISKNLNAHGFVDILEAKDGSEALQMLDPDIQIILTDWNMPVMDGLTFVKAVRANPQYKTVPILMVTTEGARAEVIEALKAGVNDYLVKPFTPTDLIDKVMRLIT